MGPGQVGAHGASAARPVEGVTGREIEHVHLLCMGGDLVVGRHLMVLGVEMITAAVRQTFGYWAVKGHNVYFPKHVYFK